MIGAIIGDVIGSRFEKQTPPISSSFELFDSTSIFTDDTILSVAIADSILRDVSYESVLREYFKKYPYAGYGSAFKLWIEAEPGVLGNSYGNGAAMRVSPIAWRYSSPQDVLEAARNSALPSHSHPEGVKGAQAIAMAIYMARQNSSKYDIKDYVSKMGYDIYGSVGLDRPSFSSAAVVTVPQAIWAFLEGQSFEDTIRKAVMIGGDTDTIASMAGEIAHAYYGVGSIPQDILDQAFNSLPEDLLDVVNRFVVKYIDMEFYIHPVQTEFNFI